MTIAVRVDDLATEGNARRARLYEILGNYKVYPYKVKGNRNMFFVIIDNKFLEQILQEACKTSLIQENFQLHVPLEYKAMRTVVTRQLDQIIDHYSDEDVLSNLELSNPWCKVDSIYRMKTPSKIIKIMFETPIMAEKALKDGIYILNQSIPARNIEKEIYVKLKPCYNCFSYDHATKTCSTEKQILCAYCAAPNHRQNDCSSTEPKCINCGGSHRTLAASCPKRKQMIKERSKQMRERSRSRSRSEARQTTHTYAEESDYAMMTGKDTTQLNRQTLEQTKQITTTILTALVSSYYFETIKPGTFQKAFDKTLIANGLPRVIVPIHDILEDYEAVIMEIVTDIRQKQSREGQASTRDKDEEEMEEGDMDLEDYDYSQKRARTQDTPPVRGQEKKQKEDIGMPGGIQRAISMESVRTSHTQQPPLPQRGQWQAQQQQRSQRQSSQHQQDEQQQQPQMQKQQQQQRT